MAQFVLVNVVVAVLMKHLEESHHQMDEDEDHEIDLEIAKEIEAERNALLEAIERQRREKGLKVRRPLMKMASLPSNFTFACLSTEPIEQFCIENGKSHSKHHSKHHHHHSKASSSLSSGRSSPANLQNKKHFSKKPSAEVCAEIVLQTTSIISNNSQAFQKDLSLNKNDTFKRKKDRSQSTSSAPLYNLSSSQSSENFSNCLTRERTKKKKCPNNQTGSSRATSSNSLSRIMMKSCEDGCVDWNKTGDDCGGTSKKSHSLRVRNQENAQNEIDSGQDWKASNGQQCDSEGCSLAESVKIVRPSDGREQRRTSENQSRTESVSIFNLHSSRSDDAISSFTPLLEQQQQQQQQQRQKQKRFKAQRNNSSWKSSSKIVDGNNNASTTNNAAADNVNKINNNNNASNGNNGTANISSNASSNTTAPAPVSATTNNNNANNNSKLSSTGHAY